MPGLGRVGDSAHAEHVGVKTEAKAGSPDVFINGRAVLRVGDGGDKGPSGEPSWQGKKGSQTLFVNGLPALQEGDETKHIGDLTGALVESSPDVTAGSSKGSKAEVPHDKSFVLSVKDALGREVHDLAVKIFCPHKDHPDLTGVDGGATIAGLCAAATVSVYKALQAGTWDDDAVPRAASFPQTKHLVTPGSGGPASPIGAAQSTDPGAPAAPPADPVPAPPADPVPADPVPTIQAPAPASTPVGDPGVHIVRAAGSTDVVVPTVYNWVELVYQAFGHKVVEQPNQLYLLGVREASLGPHVASAKPPSAEDLEKLADKGDLEHVDFIREKKTATYNDLLFAVWSDKSANHTQHVEVFECTIDASPSKKGHLHLPTLHEGHLLHGTPGDFHPKTYPGKHTALHLFGGKAEKHEKVEAVAQKVIELAHAQIGITESPPNSNRQKFGVWYGMNGVAWCAEFVSWCMAHAGMPHIRYAGCTTGAGEFRSGAFGSWHAGGVSGKAEPGDVVFYHFTGSTSQFDHTGIVVRDNGSTITTIEGNTTPTNAGSQDNGGGVFLKTRYKSWMMGGVHCIGGYGRPKYETTDVAEPYSVIRWGGEKDTVVLKNVAAHTVLHHHYFAKDKHGHQEVDPKAERYARFKNLINGADNRAYIPYLITSAHYLSLYPEWVKWLGKNPGVAPLPASVIKKTGLASPAGHAHHYVPSFFSKKYADKVLKEAHSMKDHKKAAEIKDELLGSLFTLKI